MPDEAKVQKIRDKIAKNEKKIESQIRDIEKIWEDTGLDPQDQSYLIEKTMRFEMAHASIAKAFALFKETIEEYKSLCAEIEKKEE